MKVYVSEEEYGTHLSSSEDGHINPASCWICGRLFQGLPVQSGGLLHVHNVHGGQHHMQKCRYLLYKFLLSGPRDPQHQCPLVQAPLLMLSTSLETPSPSAQTCSLEENLTVNEMPTFPGMSITVIQVPFLWRLRLRTLRTEDLDCDKLMIIVTDLICCQVPG